MPDTPNGLGWQDTRDLGVYRSAGAFRKGFPEEVEPGLLLAGEEDLGGKCRGRDLQGTSLYPG